MKALYSLVVVTIITALSVDVMNQTKTTVSNYNKDDFDKISIAIRKANDSILKVNREKTIKVVKNVRKLDSANAMMKKELDQAKGDLKSTEKELIIANNELSNKDGIIKEMSTEPIIITVIRKKNLSDNKRKDTLVIHRDSINEL